MTVVRIPNEILQRSPVDPGPGEHLWIFSVAFRMSDQAARAMAEGKDAGDILMDHENLVSAPGAGCYKCEEPFSKRLYYRKCKGSMDLQ